MEETKRCLTKGEDGGMKKWRMALCITVFALLCALVMLFLHQFMQQDQTVYEYPQWQSAELMGEDGSPIPQEIGPGGTVAGMENGGWYRLSTQLTGLADRDYLILNYAGAEAVVYLDGQEVFRSSSAASYGSLVMGEDQVQIPLPPEAESCLLEMEFRVLDPSSCIYPPLVRLSSLWLEDGSTMAYANLTGIPSGAFAVVFLLVCGLFLLGVSQGHFHGRLLVLAVAAALLTLLEINQGMGYYFLPQGLNTALNWSGFQWITPVLLLAYLISDRDRGALRRLAAVTAVSAVVLAAAAAVSAVRGGPLFTYLRALVVTQLPYGIYDNLLFSLTEYLVLACAAISAFSLFSELSSLRAEARAMEVRQRLTEENYRHIVEQHHRTAQLRHEWNNQLAALNLLYRENKLAELGEKLTSLGKQIQQIMPRDFAEHYAINIILQNAAAKAADLGVQFHAQASVPETVELDESDLCTLLINMLDNALEAAAQVEPPREREVWCRLTYTQGFLAIQCENSCTGRYRRDEKGQLLSTKQGEGHGLGLAQMRAVAEKFHGILDIQCLSDRFTVQTALKP